MTIDNPQNPGKAPKRNRQREQLIIALLQQSSLEKAAASAGVSVSTAFRIRKTPEFQTESSTKVLCRVVVNRVGAGTFRVATGKPAVI
jgi:hypothetical protein